MPGSFLPKRKGTNNIAPPSQQAHCQEWVPVFAALIPSTRDLHHRLNAPMRKISHAQTRSSWSPPPKGVFLSSPYFYILDLKMKLSRTLWDLPGDDPSFPITLPLVCRKSLAS